MPQSDTHTEHNIPFVDLHSHLQFSDFDEDREIILANMKEQGVLAIIVGTTYETSLAGVELAEQYPEQLRAIVGVHPVYAGAYDRDNIEHDEKNIEMFFTDEHLRAYVHGIGECGMDFFRGKEGLRRESDIESVFAEEELQEKIFQAQIDLAKKYNKPLMLHVRDSYQKTLDILSKNFNTDSAQYRGNAHFFVGSKDEAKAFLDLGFSISFTGVITFVEAYRELVEYVPLERMFAETEAKFISVERISGYIHDVPSEAPAVRDTDPQPGTWRR